MRVILFLAVLLSSHPWSTVPVLSKERFRPMEAHAKSLDSSIDELLRYETVKESSDLPLRQRLYHAGDDLRVLPSRFYPGEWYDLRALGLKIYESNRWVPIGNFTTYPDAAFLELQKAFQKKDEHRLAELLISNYEAYLSGMRYHQASTTALFYPSMLQLKIEALYSRIPWISLLIGLYLTAGLCLLSKWLLTLGTLALASGAGLHTILLGLRCYLLNRPPVANMSETILYVPWIMILLSFVLWLIIRKKTIWVPATFVSALLLAIILFSSLSDDLASIPPVLNSQFWLSIHVLLVVGSYGAFLLSGILAHVYLMQPDSNKVFSCVKYAMYVGLALLIPGTILGGVWAAESWGRFWDWDPKESWAFISICVYLIFLHCYRYRIIGPYVLAMGSIIGLQAITFTWYGVNYLLGTGLHSYGFGSGGVGIYVLFVFLEILFLSRKTWQKNTFQI